MQSDVEANYNSLIAGKQNATKIFKFESNLQDITQYEDHQHFDSIYDTYGS